MINLRQDGTNGNVFSKTEQLFELDQARQLKQLSEAELMQEVEHKKILMLVHGINQPIVDVLSFYLTLEQQHLRYLARHYDAIIGFIWPGGETKFDYYQSKKYARKAGSRFRNWMCRFNNAQCTVDVMNQGTGSLVVYHSIELWKEFSIRNIFSIGAGVPQEVLTNDTHMERVLNQVENIYVFYIENGHTSKDELSATEIRKMSGRPKLVNWKEELARKDKVTLVNFTELISHYPGYESLTVVSEFIDDLLSGSQHPQRITLNQIEGSISEPSIKKWKIKENA